MASPLPETPATPSANPPDATSRPFTRAQFEAAPSEILSRGRWANAVLYVFRQGAAVWAVKDFRPRSFVVRNTVGRFLVRREVCALRKVAGVAGVPGDAFRLDAHALAYRFIAGEPLNQVELGQRNAEFFAALEQLLVQVHAVGSIVHLDVRNTRNVLVCERGGPAVLDFQAHLSTRWMPARARRWIERFDLAGVYKHWARRSPDTLGEAREGVLAQMNRWRRLWPLRGYLGARKSHLG